MPHVLPKCTIARRVPSGENRAHSKRPRRYSPYASVSRDPRRTSTSCADVPPSSTIRSASAIMANSRRLTMKPGRLGTVIGVLPRLSAKAHTASTTS